MNDTYIAFVFSLILLLFDSVYCYPANGEVRVAPDPNGQGYLLQPIGYVIPTDQLVKRQDDEDGTFWESVQNYGRNRWNNFRGGFSDLWNIFRSAGRGIRNTFSGIGGGGGDDEEE